MAERPLDYLRRYQPVQFAGCGTQGQKSIHVRSYVSGDVMSGNAFRKKAYLDVKRFVERSDRYAADAFGSAHHRYDTDTGYLVAPDLKPIPFHHCPWVDVRQAFQGKGTPVRMARVLKLLDYYLRHAQINPAQLGWGKVVTDLQEYVDYYIGLDCNGFVGAWLEDNQPGSGSTGNIDIDSIGSYYNHKTSGSHYTRIDDPREIRTGDVLVRRRIGDSTRHVALVETVNAASSTEASLLLAEATGASGLGTNQVVLKKLASPTGTGRHWKRGDKEYDAVIRSK